MLIYADSHFNPGMSHPWTQSPDTDFSWGLQVLNEKLFVLDLFDFGFILTKAEVGVHLTVSPTCHDVNNMRARTPTAAMFGGYLLRLA